MMKKLLLAGLVLAMAGATPAFAHSSGHPHSVSEWLKGWGDFGFWPDDDQFSNATLQGTYVFQASGFADDGKPGEAAVLGTLTFTPNGDTTTGTVLGSLVLTRGDNAQFSCADNFTDPSTPPIGSYTLTSDPTAAPGLFSMTIPLTGSSSGTLNFGLLVPRPEGPNARVIETDSGTLSLKLCGGNTIVGLVLKGSLHRLDDSSGD
ncbi:MAG TPA: hypothetical protein VJN94_06485 [Candidatus Binataceae bacterium]|nr:hypothetical protein [Candidatus Binataceae bacterium]